MKPMPDPKEYPDFYISRINLLANLYDKGIVSAEYKDQSFYIEKIREGLMKFLDISERSKEIYDKTSLVYIPITVLPFIAAIITNHWELTLLAPVGDAATYLYNTNKVKEHNQKAIEAGKPALIQWEAKTGQSIVNHPEFNHRESKSSAI